MPLGLRLFLPDEWARDPDRGAGAGVPEEHRRVLAKTEIALAEIDRVIAAGARFGRVLADAGYGMGAAFRQGLSARGLAWAVGILKTQNVYLPTVELRWPTTVTRRPRKHPVPSEAPSAAEAMLASAAWRRISWRHGTKGPLAAEFAALRVRPAEGDQLRNGWHLPGEEIWLVGERRASGEQKYYLSNLPADTPLDELAATIKARLGRLLPAVPAATDRARCARWVCEQVHQQMKEELGLDHFEGRSTALLSTDRPAPPRVDDDDGLHLPAAPAARASQRAGKKAAQPNQDHRRSPPCRRFDACCLSGSGVPFPAAPIVAPASDRRCLRKCQSSASTAKRKRLLHLVVWGGWRR